MTTISSISSLLSLSNCQFRVYDLGRKVEKLSKETFKKIEHCQLSYPTPIQGHAQLAIAFWQKQSPQPYIWFIKLALDERGLLNQGTRNHFIAIIVEALGNDLSVDPNEKQEELLKSNPYLFTPSQYKLAMLNSFLKVELKQASSEHYHHFVNYLSLKNWQNWQSIGVQGLTDFAARLSENNNVELLASALKHLPFEVLSPLCGALENCTLPVDVIKQILHLLNAPELQDINREQMLIRSLSSSIEHPFVDEYFAQLLQNDALSDNILITLAGRCWQVLNDQTRTMQYLELLVKHGSELFAAIFKDLVAIPTIRPLLFQCMRATERTPELAKAIGQLFNPQN